MTYGEFKDTEYQVLFGKGNINSPFSKCKLRYNNCYIISWYTEVNRLIVL